MAIGKSAMDDLEIAHHYNGIYRKRSVLLTGHTGFKGSWLALWLGELGAQVNGVALSPATQPNHWDLLKLGIADHRLDIRDAAYLARTVQECQPEIIFHLAAQPLVRHSYLEPLETWSTNVLGTANILEASRHCSSVKAIVVVTTDKCYENQELPRGYCETDRLGGHDPYSASKACAELLSVSYRKSFFDRANAPLLATARAGNVIGGGDWSEDRLVPDLIRAVQTGTPLQIRSPNSTRPWQHVLESLAGYLLLGQRLLEGNIGAAEAWNFGPDDEDSMCVKDVLTTLKSEWDVFHWKQASEPKFHETVFLKLDSTKARRHLGWQPIWSLDEGLKATAQWYKAYLETGEVVSRQQLYDYIAKARNTNCVWVSQ